MVVYTFNLALRRQRLRQRQSNLQTSLVYREDNQGYTEKRCLRKQNNSKQQQNKQTELMLPLVAHTQNSNNQGNGAWKIKAK